MSENMSGATNSPIADLTYRHYDGPLNSTAARWWSIAKMTIRAATQRRAFWGWSLFSAWWYFLLLIVYWFIDNVIPNLGGGNGGLNPILSQTVWKDQFITGFSYSQMILMVITLLVGAGTIANDNKSNALLIYLSKPASKFDYIFGKWMGVFLLIFGVAVTPMLVFYGYCYMSFQEYGFWTSAPWLFLRLILVAAASGALHASLSLAISSLFNQGRVAGATYAGLYFMSYIFTQVANGFNANPAWTGEKTPWLVQQLFYCSIDGVQIGIAKLIVGTTGSRPFGAFPMGGRRNRGGEGIPEISLFAPDPTWIVPVAISIIVAGFLIAWSRVKGVEVVG
jgi:ABC-2 type transport system permease protein